MMSPFTLEVCKDGEPVETLVFETLPSLVVKIGSLPSSKLRLEDPSVARMHAVIEYNRKEDKFIVIDLGSSVGVLLQGEQIVKNAVLHDGASLQFGVFTVLFKLGIHKAIEESPDPKGLKLVPPVVLLEERPEYKALVEETAREIFKVYKEQVRLQILSFEEKLEFFTKIPLSVNQSTVVDLIKNVLAHSEADSHLELLYRNELGMELVEKFTKIFPLPTKEEFEQIFDPFFKQVTALFEKMKLEDRG